MKALVGVVFAIVIASCLGACSWDKPISNAPTKDYPCGVVGVVCGGGMCCDEYEACGGGPFNGCPAGQCCYVGPEEYGAKRDGGEGPAHPMHEQRPASH